MGAGIFIGAIWANQSWGRYWGWDPKEVWALIVFLLMGFTFHNRTLVWFRKPLFYHIFVLIIFLAVLMTYFGVNYILGGKHSYAG
jgi:ABC-type transport system involved in cytochrome c biogenesis permease subunit